ncbi:MAG: glycosyltransferase [Bacillota bacterium]|nr:glycosyltransferase [Bacillota bacterium]
MKVLLVADIHQRMISGVYVSMMNLAHGLKSMGHEVKLLIVSDRVNNVKTPDSYQIASFNASMFYPNIRLIFPFSDIVHIHDIIRWHPDVIHTQSEFFTMSRAFYIARRLGIPVIHTYHTLWGDPEYIKYFNKYFGGFISESTVGMLLRNRLLTERIAALIAPTEKTREILLSYGIDKPIYIIPSGIYLSKFSSLPDEEFLKRKREEFGFKPDDKVMLFVGRVSKEKHIAELMEYYFKAKNDIPNLKFLIVGGGPESEHMREMADASPYSKDVILTGLVSTTEVHKYYSLGDVFATASTSETQGITYIEAMASGTPVLCREDKSVEELMKNGVNGLTFEDYETFRKGLLDLIYDQNKREEIINNAKQTASVFSVEHFTESVVGVYRDAIEAFS